jgi:hypothetical protein
MLSIDSNGCNDFDDDNYEIQYDATDSSRRKPFGRIIPSKNAMNSASNNFSFRPPSGVRSRNHQMKTMEGLISNANKILEHAMRPGLKGVHSGQFRTCAGICIISSVQVGYIISGSIGSGIFMKHNFDGTWSNPVAVGITTLGLGAAVGATVKDALIFMTDFQTVETFFKTGVRLGGRANL